jgi:isopentenyl diphosphate isomerase/L-lactate dehydrogenase-like FMN-dependent dehydrogenase
VVGPPLAELLARYSQAALTRHEHEIRPAGGTAMPEQIARVLALGPDGGMLAREVVDQLRLEGTVKKRLAEVRMALRGCAAFTEVSRGRWRLGVPATDTKPELPMEELT